MQPEGPRMPRSPLPPCRRNEGFIQTYSKLSEYMATVIVESPPLLKA
jgi:hypothetical protein